MKDVDIYMPAATQNGVTLEWAKKIAESGVKYDIEVANMPATNDALSCLRARKDMTVAPSKAVNADGVATSGFEMSPNAMRCRWTAEEVDAAEKAGLGCDLVAGGSIAGFLLAAEAMMAQGLVSSDKMALPESDVNQMVPGTFFSACALAGLVV